MSQLGDTAKSLFGFFGARNDKKDARKERQNQLKFVQDLDWEPERVSGTESPIASSYLNSFLLGNNPNATFSGAPNAAITKKQQQLSQNAMFGTPEERLARANSIQQGAQGAAGGMPNAAGNYGDQGGGQRKITAGGFAAMYPELAKLGLTPEDMKALNQMGLPVKADTDYYMGDQYSAVPSAGGMQPMRNTTPENMERAVALYRSGAPAEDIIEAWFPESKNFHYKKGGLQDMAKTPYKGGW